MGVAEDIRELAASVPQRRRYLRSEEATKNSLVMPFLSALGYDIHDPLEVIPEFTADAGVRQQEKVDYAIMKDRRPSILVECKSANVSLGKDHLSQLLRYYAVTDARFGILTNGVEYRFYTDLRKRNVMDEEPFLVVDMRELDDKTVAEVARFAKLQFDAQAIWDLMHTQEIEQRDLQTITANISREFTNPSKELVRIFARGVLGKGHQPKAERERVTQLTKRALDQLTGKHDPGNGVPVPPLPDPVPPRPGEEPDFSIFWYWRQTVANAELHCLFKGLVDYLKSLGEEIWVDTASDGRYFTVKPRRGGFFNICKFAPQPQKNRIRIVIPGREGETFFIANQDEFEDSMEKLQRAYVAAIERSKT